MKNHKELALDAIDLVKPAIIKLFERTNRKELHIVVMDPTLKPWESEFKDAILIEESFGSPDEWTIKFDELARNKTRQAWRNGSANINNQTLHTSSLREGDVLFYGTFVYGDIVVGCSGVQPYYDMLISSWIALAFEQLSMAEYQLFKEKSPMEAYKK